MANYLALSQVTVSKGSHVQEYERKNSPFVLYLGPLREEEYSSGRGAVRENHSLSKLAHWCQARYWCRLRREIFEESNGW